ncbi:hypothetical protein [Psychroflexus lacisalsi]|jgi:hypothetical protein|uniref:Uncharacterized protein n=1 Tax=Psychroflexus lacisalsi TaxID=503928 RepID=A0ABN1K1H1_9FLAO|nr:hypothetical protein [Psychroflexus lacisalsi]MBZ9620837.1 hypothetical protein [Psychroflexus lacisalsi]
MKKILLVMVMALGTTFLMSFTNVESKIIEHEVTLESKFDEGFKDGYCEGWKDVKGKYAYCPYPPYPPYPEYPQSSDSYRDGYNTGFKAGMKAARKD